MSLLALAAALFAISSDFEPVTASPVSSDTVSPVSSDWQCPVCGMTFNASSYASKAHVVFAGGQTIAIGGPGCVKKFNKDPPSFLNDTRVPVKPSRAGEKLVCPVSGETFTVPADEEAHYVQFNNGQAIYTCCPMCIGQLKANLTKFIKALPSVSAVEEQDGMDGSARRFLSEVQP